MKTVKRGRSSLEDLFGVNAPRTGRNVEIGKKVVFGASVVLYDNVVIEDGCSIGANVIVGEPALSAYRESRYENPRTVIGRDAIIRSGTVVYAGCNLGPNLSTGHYAVIRENTVCGDQCSFGTFATSDGDVKIGDRCRFHYYAHVCKTAKIGKDVWMFPKSMLLNDTHPPCGRCLQGPTLSDRAIIGSAATIAPKVRIGKDALIAAASMVTKDVPDGMVAMGVPARIVAKASEVECRTGLLDHPYPWVRNYSRPR